MRVLQCGIFSDLFITDLARAVRQTLPFEIDAFNIEVLRAATHSLSVFGRVTTSRELSDGELPRSDTQSWTDHRQREDARLLRSPLAARLDGYGLYHWHTLFVKSIWQLARIPRDRPMLVSVWGSDLLRVAGEYEYGRQLELLRRADAISVQTLELREILLAKFGRDLGTKVHLRTFGLSRLNEIARPASATELAGFRDRHSIPAARHTIAVGHSATPFDQHPDVLRQLGGLDASLRQQCVVVLPMAYGGSDGYVDQVRTAAATCGLRAVVLRAMLDDREVALLRTLCDVLIYVPASDALSGTVSETLYAGRPVITGAWLPYWSRVHRERLAVVDVMTMDEIAPAVQHVLRSPPTIDLPRTRAAIDRHAHWDQVGPEWARLYRLLMNA